MLIVSPQGLEADGFRYQNVYQSGYFVGRLDYSKPELKHGEFTELDQGFDFYAPQTLEDDQGRRILFAWMAVLIRMKGLIRPLTATGFTA